MTRAEKVIEFISNLTIPSGYGIGKPFVLREWQKRIVRGIYDGVDANSIRIVRTALISMARKNGKTALIAALVLAHLVGPEAIANGELYSAARDRFQASQVFKFCAQMIRLEPELAAVINIVESTKRLVCVGNGSFYCALSSEAKAKHGFSASLVIYDELAQAPNRELYDVLTTSMGAREEPLVVVISTMTNDVHSVMYELVEYGRNVSSGIIVDPTFKLWVWEVPLDEDPWDEANWYLANPGLGDFRSLDEMRVMAQRAQKMPSAAATFFNLYLNQCVSGSNPLISRIDWDACGTPVDRSALRGLGCFAGMDLSTRNDLTALVLIFPRDDGFDVLPFFWIPEYGIEEKAKQDRVPYLIWRDQEYLVAVPDRSIQYEWVVHTLGNLSREFEIKKIFYDRFRIDDLKAAMSTAGLDLPLEEFGQGFVSMAPAVDAMETAILNHQLRHGGHPVLSWNAANAVAVQDPAGNRKLAKNLSTGRIDGIVALAMALRGCQTTPIEEKSFWEV